MDNGDDQIESDNQTVTDLRSAGVDDRINVETVPDPEAEQARLDAEMDSQYGEQMQEHKLHPRCPRDYDHVHAQLENTLMTQQSIKKGLKVFGEDTAKAVGSKMQQLHKRGAIKLKKTNMLTQEENQKAPHYLMFLKKKRCSRIKVLAVLMAENSTSTSPRRKQALQWWQWSHLCSPASSMQRKSML